MVEPLRQDLLGTICISISWTSVLVHYSPAVIDALKTLQEKIRRLELERKQAEKSYQAFCSNAQKHQPFTAANPAASQPVAGLSATDNTSRKGEIWAVQRGRTLSS